MLTYPEGNSLFHGTFAGFGQEHNRHGQIIVIPSVQQLDSVLDQAVLGARLGLALGRRDQGGQKKAWEILG